jgi:hypothetical protein
VQEAVAQFAGVVAGRRARHSASLLQVPLAAASGAMASTEASGVAGPRDALEQPAMARRVRSGRERRWPCFRACEVLRGAFMPPLRQARGAVARKIAGAASDAAERRQEVTAPPFYSTSTYQLAIRPEYEVSAGNVAGSVGEKVSVAQYAVTVVVGDSTTEAVPLNSTAIQ